jgi:hypothetical protein
MTKCKVCDRPRDGDAVYCRRHLKAYSNLEEAYGRWRYALGLNWMEYLEKMTKTGGVGVWVREVAEDILRGL